MRELDEIHVAVEVLAILLFFGYLGNLLVAVIRLNHQLPVDRKIGYGFALLHLDTVIHDVTSTNGQRSLEYRMLTNARRMYSLAICGLLVAIALDLVRIVVTP